MEKVFQIELRKVYPLLVAKAERRNKWGIFLANPPFFRCEGGGFLSLIHI